MSKIIEKIYENGRYVGEFFQDERCGNGTFYYNDGSVYTGEWFFNYRSGNGTYTWPNGDKYIGEFLDDYRTGNGIYYYNEGQWKGDRYEGEFNNSKQHGFGIYYYASGKILYGKWKNGKLIEKYNTKEDYENAINPPIPPIFDKKIPLMTKSSTIKEIAYNPKSKYLGNVNKNNVPNGYGLMIWDDGSCYIGNYKNNHMDGYGILFYENGTIHMGKFKNSNYGGYAISIDEDYALFAKYDEFDVIKEIGFKKDFKYYFNEEILEFVEDIKEDTCYIGEFLNNTYHGLGILQDKSTTTIGQFKNGKLNGIGIKIINETEVYLGQFENNYFNGYGIKIDNSKNIKYGKWENNIYLGNK